MGGDDGPHHGGIHLTNRGALLSVSCTRSLAAAPTVERKASVWAPACLMVILIDRSTPLAKQCARAVEHVTVDEEMLDVD
jgi:hypothetical protein